MIKNINRIFTTIILLSLFTFMGRADYNLPLFSFAIILWNHKKPPQKIRIWYLIVFSILVDFIWLIYYSILWKADGYTPFVFYDFTLVMSTIIFIVKISLMVILVMRDAVCRNSLITLPKQILDLAKGGNSQ